MELDLLEWDEFMWDRLLAVNLIEQSIHKYH